MITSTYLTGSHGAAVPLPAGFQPWFDDELISSVPARFEKMVQRDPDKIAVQDQWNALSYAKLNRRINRLAHQILAQRGSTAEPVALLLPHRNEIIIALLATLKAGKFYVPLDPSYPEPRLKGMMASSGVKVLITDNEHAALAEALGQGGDILILNVELPLDDEPDHNPSLALEADTLFNLIYTSGSTGKPKGALQTHGNVVFDTRASTNILKLAPDDRFALIVPCSFGASASDIFGALLTGATLLLFDIRSEGLAALADWTRQMAITVTHTVPTIFRQWMALIPKTETYPAMRLIKLGGEPLLLHDFQLFQQHFSDTCILRNALGTTETFMVSCYLMNRQMQLVDALLPVGFPMQGRTVAILDDAGQTLGPGETGQIAVESAYLSPGYWQQPDLNESVFLNSPKGKGTRIYLTNDLGRINQDGCLVHLGRIDEMVKIRGQQVDLAAVEMALLAHPAVNETVIVAHKNENGIAEQLVAYLVPTTQPGPTVSELRLALAEQLPDHMIPTTYIMMEKFPLLPFGKVNRRALPAPDSSRPALSTPYEPPQTPNQATLCQIFGELNNLDRVGIHDNIFELGADSLKATQFAARIRATFKIDLPLAHLFENPTVASLATLILTAQTETLETTQLDQLLTELENLSDEAVERLLNQD